MLVRKTWSGVACTGDGMAARCTTASMPGIRSAPLTASSACPKSVSSAGKKGAGVSGEYDSADGTRSMLSTSCPCSSRSRTTALPALPLPPVTAIFIVPELCPSELHLPHRVLDLADDRVAAVLAAGGFVALHRGDVARHHDRDYECHRELHVLSN